MEKRDFVVLGAGLAGCAAARELQSRGADYVLLERNAEPGGLSRSISLDRALFDYTGHFLHLSQWPTPAAIPHAGQDDRDWIKIERRSGVFIDGRVVPAPFQYHLAAAPPLRTARYLEDFRNRPSALAVRSFRDYLLSHFGTAICEAFFFPYQEKQTALPLEAQSPSSVTRFFPPPDAARIEAGAAPGTTGTPAGLYNDVFWYPRNDGIRLLAGGLACGAKGLRTNAPVESVRLRKKILVTPQGEIAYRTLMTSAPLKAFCRMTDDDELRRLADGLSHNRVLCLNLLLRGEAPEALRGLYWVYVPAREIPFYRLGLYSELSKALAPAGHTSLYVEAAFPETGPEGLAGRVVEDVWESLETLGWARRADGRAMSASWIDCAYVHFNHARRDLLAAIFERLREAGVRPIGRYGLWDYLSMEGAIASGLNAAAEAAR